MQGELVLKDFNIQELAGNSFIGIDKTFVAQVSNGVLDIHLFYAGKGTCCTSDGRWSFGPLISAVSATNVLNRENLEPSFCLPILMLSSTILGCQLLCNCKNLSLKSSVMLINVIWYVDLKTTQGIQLNDVLFIKKMGGICRAMDHKWVKKNYP